MALRKRSISLLLLVALAAGLVPSSAVGSFQVTSVASFSRRLRAVSRKREEISPLPSAAAVPKKRVSYSRTASEGIAGALTCVALYAILEGVFKSGDFSGFFPILIGGAVGGLLQFIYALILVRFPELAKDRLPRATTTFSGPETRSPNGKSQAKGLK